MTDDTQPQAQLINTKETAKLVGVSVTTIYALVKKGEFPQPKKIGRATRWRLADVQAFINS